MFLESFELKRSAPASEMYLRLVLFLFILFYIFIYLFIFFFFELFGEM